MVEPKPEGPPPTGALERLARLALVLLFLLALAGGVALLVRTNAPGGMEVILPTATPPPSLQVYLTGAVASPGVYTFQDGERLEGLLERAGGATGDADLARTNLALRLRDGEHIHVLRVGEEGGAPASPGGAVQPALLDLNRATAAELEALPGIGAVRAAAVLEYRDRHGGFRSVEELLEVPGLGPATVAGIADLVTAE